MLSNGSSSEKFLVLYTFLTGFFAIIGSVFTWGQGLIFTVDHPLLHLIITDLLITAPLCILLSYSLYKRKPYADYLRVFVSAILIFGSLEVYIYEFTKNSGPELIFLLIPVSGIILSIVLLSKFVFVFKNTNRIADFAVN